MENPGLIQSIDCVRFYVDNLQAGLDFYRNLGLELAWRTETAMGLRMPHIDAEIVL